MYNRLSDIAQALNFAEGDAYTGIIPLKGFSIGDCGGAGPSERRIKINKSQEMNYNRLVLSDCGELSDDV